ncbi:membrane protein insertion efficiency factor YidD [Chrysiogenes arsenatis]|uniref:membrane protein insertion efficiency factor YidD n=1 Tax=Chrysiogenes arsenatis TaxID=309797 RepID=UPI00048700E5|nr:membrane protein insertion efficiency factor YidD [Chrysiogenes arsenatis]
MKYLAIWIVQFYRYVISPLKPPSCRFLPTCSEYSLESFRRFGFMRGSYLTARRILRCHPFHPGGVDIVPEKMEVFRWIKK